MNKRLLTICIPSYNRKNVLIDDVISYLKLDDARYCIKINDNASNDGTVEALLDIHSDRLIVRQNQVNVGGVPNWLMSLTNCDSEYVIFLLDKDQICIDVLPVFLDYLESERPFFGYVDLSMASDFRVDTYPSGVDGINAMCYLDKHPSGYFFRTSVFNEALHAPFFQTIDEMFIFPFEVMNTSIAVKYPSVVVHFPLIRNASIRPQKDTKSLSFTSSNIWFGIENRVVEFSYYIQSVFNLSLQNIDQRLLCRRIYSKMLHNVSVLYRRFLSNEDVCSHYYLHQRHVGFLECVNNLMIVSRCYLKLSYHKIPLCILLIHIFIELPKAIIRIIIS